MMNEIGADDTGESGLYDFLKVLGTYKERYLQHVPYQKRHFDIFSPLRKCVTWAKKCQFAKNRHKAKKASFRLNALFREVTFDAILAK